MADNSAAAVFDRAVVLDRARGDADLMRRILRSFVNEAQLSLRTLQAVERHDNPQFARDYAYTLRVAAANAGACALAATAAHLEHEVGPPPAPGFTATLAQLATNLAEFHSAVAAEIGE